MKFLFDITHPAHVHLWKHVIWDLQKKGHETRIVARDKDLTVALLQEYRFEFSCLSRARKGLGLLFELWEHEKNLYPLCQAWRPDLMLNVVGTFVAPVGKMLGIKTAGFTDTEHANLTNRLTFPWVDYVFTPSCFEKNIGKKQIRYESYHELAYLHPDRFRPDPSVLREFQIPEGEPFFVLRFVSWNAAHDAGERGFSESGKIKIVEMLSQKGRVFITSESKLPPGLESYRIRASPSRIHDLLYYSTLYLGEGGTMASEAALLGTPAIFVSTLRLGYLNEQEKKYGLTFSFDNEKQALDKAIDLLNSPNLKAEWAKKLDRLLQDKEDLSSWILRWIEKNV